MLQYVSGDYQDETTYTTLRNALDGARRHFYYLAIPPSYFTVTDRCHTCLLMPICQGRNPCE